MIISRLCLLFLMRCISMLTYYLACCLHGCVLVPRFLLLSLMRQISVLTRLLTVLCTHGSKQYTHHTPHTSRPHMPTAQHHCFRAGTNCGPTNCKCAHTSTQVYRPDKHPRTHARTDTHTVNKHNRSLKHSNEELNSHTNGHRRNSHPHKSITRTRTHAHNFVLLRYPIHVFLFFFVLFFVDRTARRCPLSSLTPTRILPLSLLLLLNKLFPWLPLQQVEATYPAGALPANPDVDVQKLVSDGCGKLRKYCERCNVRKD